MTIKDWFTSWGKDEMKERSAARTETATAIAEVPVAVPRGPRRPFEPRPVTDVTKAELREYRKVCRELQVKPHGVRYLELREFLAQQGIPEYDPTEVVSYMNRVAQHSGKTWKWYGVRQADLRHPHPCEIDVERTDPSMRWDCGRIETTRCHRHPIPPAVLHTMSRILKKFKDARFFVSDYEVPKPDPFLAVGFPNLPLMVVDFWNEPSFKPTKLA